jgi:hypothetical protein
VTVDGERLSLKDDGDDGDKYENYTFVMPEADVVLGGTWTAISGGPANVRYVYEHGPAYAPNAGGAGNGRSWQTATGDLQAVMDDPDADTFEIWMTGGTYYPDWTAAIASGQPYIGVNPRNSQTWSFRPRDGVTVYGGFAGTETARGGRDSGKIAGSNETVLSGGNNGKAGPLYHRPMTVEGVNDAKINDLTLAYGAEGGLTITSSDNLTLTNVTIRNNVKTSEISRYGGGVLVGNSNIGQIVFDGCTIRNNLGRTAGGLMFSINDGTGTVELRNCTIMDNYAFDNGGGICFSVQAAHNSLPTLIIRQSRIVNNIANGTGGGVFIFATYNAKVTMDHVEISGNWGNVGGGIAYSLVNPDTVLEHCTITGNYSPTASYGGIVRSSGSGTIAVRNSVIWGNGTSATQNSAGPTFTNSLIQNAEASIGTNCLDGTDPQNDPLFAGLLDYTAAPTANGNYRLREGSPLIGAASDSGNIGAYNSAGVLGP